MYLEFIKNLIFYTELIFLTITMVDKFANFHKLHILAIFYYSNFIHKSTVIN